VGTVGVPSRSRYLDSTGVNVVIRTPPRTSAATGFDQVGRVIQPVNKGKARRSMTATFATITARMRFNFFSQDRASEPERPAEPSDPQPTPALPAPTGRSFPADEVVWGIAIRNGYDEMDDPVHHRGTTQHAYLEGNDNVAICGFRPPQSGPRTRRRSRLGLPTSGEHPMCGMCARMVVAPRPRAPIPVQSSRPPVAVPVQPGRPPAAVPVSPGGAPSAPAGVVPLMTAAPAIMPPGSVSGAPMGQPQPQPMSPWVRQRSGIEEPAVVSVELGSRHETGLLDRGVYTERKDG
jgi:hypothetical protein